MGSGGSSSGKLGLEGPAWRTPRNFIGQAEAVLASTAEQGLEGFVAKRLQSPYKRGARNGAWVKHKHRRSEAFLITAWAPAQPGRPESFFLARLSDGGREPAGSVSLGVSSEERERLRAALEAAEAATPQAPPAGAAGGAGGAGYARLPRAGARTRARPSAPERRAVARQSPLSAPLGSSAPDQTA